ncbi:MAG: Hpt domain-containing protein [Alphaproteobacteria bacterium]
MTAVHAGLLSIDPAPIGDLLDCFGIDGAREAVVRLSDGVERKLRDIEAAVSGRAASSLRRPAHDLASLAGSLGLLALECAARDIERACDAGDEASALAVATSLSPLVEGVPSTVAAAFVDAVRGRLPSATAASGRHWGGAA